jgi:hypothetical protein
MGLSWDMIVALLDVGHWIALETFPSDREHFNFPGPHLALSGACIWGNHMVPYKR